MFYDAAIVQQLYVESDSVTRQHGGAARLGRRFVHRVSNPNIIFKKWLLCTYQTYIIEQFNNNKPVYL